MIESSAESDLRVARIEGDSTIEACHCVAPATLPPIDSPDVGVDLGIIGRTGGGKVEFLKSCIVFLLSPVKANT